MNNEEQQLRDILEDPDAIRKIAQGDKELFRELLKEISDEERRRFLHYKPYSKQLEFHNSMATERILSGANQSGKVQKGDNLVLTDKGWRQMASIKEGDILFDRFGKKTRVLKVFPHKNWDFYRVTFDDGSWLETGMEHLWMVKQTKGERFGKLDWDVRSLEDIVKKSGLTPKVSMRPKIPVVSSVDLDKKELPIEPYLLGLLLGDGSFRATRGVMFSSCAEDMETYKKYATFVKKKGNDFDYRVKDMYIPIKKLGLYMVGSHDKFIPKEYMFGSHEQRLSLLQGLMDTDGSVCIKGHVEYCTVSKKLCKQVIELCQSIGCKAKYVYRCDKKGFHNYRVHIRQGEYPLFRLQRKLCRCKPVSSTCKERLIYKVEYVGKSDGACILVDSPDHTYIAQNYIVTHNTIAGTMETCFHLTGNYPDWWHGHIVRPRTNASNGEKEINVWVIGTDSKTVRDSLQAKIIGTEARGFRDGCIHPDFIDVQGAIKARGVQGLIDTIYIKHKSGCKVKLQFRSYEQGRENLQSATIDCVYCDEEPPADIIGELRARLGATGGFMYMAFTPLKGMTPLVQEFWGHDNPEKFLACMNIYEAKHYTPEKIRKIESLYSGLSVAERKARMMGVPTMGTGLIYPVEDKDLYYEPMEIPKRWLRMAALDFGRGEHPQAMVWGALDPVNDVLYIYDAVKTTNKTVAENASIIKHHGAWIPCAWPHDLMRESGVGDEKKTEGYKYKELYEKEGVKLTPEFAKTKDGSNKVEVGIIEVRQRMFEGRFKVATNLSEWYKEKQVYRYGDDNKPVKEKDDLMDATRYLTIMLRYAISEEENMFNSIGMLSGQFNKVQDNTPIY